MIFGPRASFDAQGSERVSVTEWASTGCWKVLVADPATCNGSTCAVLNDAGHPARTSAWFDGGRLAGEGQTAPNRRNRCTAAGSVVGFEATDTTGGVRVIEALGATTEGVD